VLSMKNRQFAVGSSPKPSAASTRMALVQLLERAGFFTQPAENADAAAEMLGGACADAFVIDVGDAEVDGERLLERLQKAGARRDVPIVVTGAHRARFRRLARCRSIAAVVPALGHSGDVVLTAARRPIPRHNVPPFAGGNLPRAFQGNSGIFRGRGVATFPSADRSAIADIGR